jgi:hypothetical protein
MDLGKYVGYTFDYEGARRDLLRSCRENDVLVDARSLIRPLLPPLSPPPFRETRLPMLSPMNPWLE